MTHAVLLSAGQGKRLSPFTDTRPKCLVQVANRSILDWQLTALYAAGIRDVTIIAGFEAESVEAAVTLNALPMRVETRFNPFYSVADNIGSCWEARDLIAQDCVLINGDTLFDPRILSRVLETADQPISVTVDQKATYDADDMKVRLEENRLARIGKTLTGRIDGESIGMLLFKNGGGARFVEQMKTMLRDAAALRLWYLSIIDQLAPQGEVGFVSINGLPWAEVDFPSDLTGAGARVRRFDWSVLAEIEPELANSATKDLRS